MRASLTLAQAVKDAKVEAFVAIENSGIKIAGAAFAVGLCVGLAGIGVRQRR